MCVIQGLLHRTHLKAPCWAQVDGTCPFCTCDSVSRGSLLCLTFTVFKADSLIIMMMQIVMSTYFIGTFINVKFSAFWASQVALVVKNPVANEEDLNDGGSIPGLRRCPGVGHGNPLQYSCLRIPKTEEPDRLQS